MGENEARSDERVIAADESGLREDLMERAFLLCLFQKQPHGFDEILLGFGLGGSTRREIKFRRVRNVHLPFFEHLARKFYLHKFHHPLRREQLLLHLHRMTTTSVERTRGWH